MSPFLAGLQYTTEVLAIVINRYVANEKSYSGGNDVGLVSLLNSCIFQMGVFTKAQAAAAKVIAEVDEEYAWANGWDWDSLSRGCEGQIQWSSSLIGAQAFNAKLDAVLTAAKKKLANGYASYSGVFP